MEDIASNISSNISNNLYSWFYKNQDMNCVKQLSDNQILEVADNINSIFSETTLVDSKPELTLPKLAVVGTQSSGKSSVLNSIMSMDILPTGQNMVTRTPLDIRLHKLEKGNNEGWVEFGTYSDMGSIESINGSSDSNDSNGSFWETNIKIPIQIPTPTDSEIKQIRDFISKKTDEIAGTGMDISTTPIILNIYSPYVPNLSLTDLPGLTMVACTDKGQPADIKDKIEHLVSTYIKQPRTIIIAVMQSRSDLETDIGLALIKKHDLSGKRTIGVLTKPDLMNYETHVGEYLTNNISKNLMLSYGYYVVKNRSGKDMNNMNIMDGLQAEDTYFKNHKEYNKIIYKDRIGTPNLSNNLSKVLIESITEMIPSVITEISALDMKISKKLEQMGQHLPDSRDGKISVLNRYASNFYYQFVDSVESRGTTLNTGKQIKDTLLNYKENLHKIRPFTNTKTYSDEYFKHVVSSFEGNHMSFHIPPIQILEACMVDEKLRPVMTLKDVSVQTVDVICDILIDLIRGIMQQDEFSQYPPLSSHIKNVMVDDIISPLKVKAKQEIIDSLKLEEDYIWTDSEEFRAILAETSKKSSFDSNSIRIMLEGYFTSVKHIVGHNVPKIIMSNIIREIEKMLLSYLFQNIVTDDKIPLLKEDNEIEKQRLYYMDLKNKITSVKSMINKNIHK
jgi:dynamin 1-like protein